MVITKRISVCFVIVSLFLLTACGGIDIMPEANPEPVPDSSPALAPESAPEPTPESTPEPVPEPTPEPEAEPVLTGKSFPFSFISEDLYGNTVRGDDLGEKELFFAYLWAVW